jgi:hypothetical protein
MLPLAGLHAASLGALVAFGLAGAPTACWWPAAWRPGSRIPPVGSVSGRCCAGLLEDDAGLLPTAYALDGIAIEMVFVTGPLLTAAIVIVASPAAALLVACGFVVLGTIVLVMRAGLARLAPDAATTSATCSARWRRPAVRTIVAATAPAGFAGRRHRGDDDRLRSDHGSRAAAGALLAVWALGSGVGGLTYGGREHTSAPGPRWVRLAALFPLCSLPLLLAPSIAAMAPLAVDRRLCLAPYMAAANQLVGDVAPAGAVTEAFAWPITAIGLGAAGGSAAAGAIAQTWGWRPGFGAVVAAGASPRSSPCAGRRRCGVGPSSETPAAMRCALPHPGKGVRRC